MSIKNITVIGSGTMGNGIAHVCAQFGYNVSLVDIAQTALDKAIVTITKNLDRQVQKQTLTEEQMKTIGVELGVIEDKELTSSLKTNGVLRVPNQNKASVNSIYSGVIKTLLVQPGSKVSRGQTIATIGNPEFIQAQSEYLNVNTRITLAELEVKRQKELLEEFKQNKKRGLF